MSIPRKIFAMALVLGTSRLASAQSSGELGRARAETITRALGSLLFPVSDQKAPAVCPTTLLVEGRHLADQLTPEARTLLARAIARPVLEGDAVSADDRLWVHAPAERSHEVLAQVSRAVIAVRSTFGDAAFPRHPLDVALQKPVGGVGCLFWDEAAARPAGILVSPDLHGEALESEILHQLTHVWQLERPMPPIPSSWLEGTAVFVAERASASRLARTIAPALSSREAGIEDVSLLASRASLPAFLWEGSGKELLRSLYASLHDGQTWDQAFAATLATADRGSVAGFTLEHAIWLALCGPRDNGKYFSFGHSLPAGRDRQVPEGVRLQIPVGAGGSTVAVVTPSTSDGGSWITVSAPRAADARALRAAVVVRSARGALRAAPIPAIGDGTLRIGVPARDVAEILVITVNVGATPALVSVASTHDPVFPFVLSSFTVEPSSDGVAVRFTVNEEESIRGWRILRSTDPAKGFASLCPILIPGRGDASEPLTYFFLDQSARPGKRYFYYLEATSVYGFSEPSFMVSVTTPGKD